METKRDTSENKRDTSETKRILAGQLWLNEEGIAQFQALYKICLPYLPVGQRTQSGFMRMIWADYVRQAGETFKMPEFRSGRWGARDE